MKMDADVKKQADAIFDELGMTTTTAVNLFLRCAIREHGFPCDLKLDPFYSRENQEHLAKSLEEYKSGNLIRKSLADLGLEE